MKHLTIVLFVSIFLFISGQALFPQHAASSSEEAVILSFDMRRGEQRQYLIDQSKRFYQQGKFEDAVSLMSYLQEKVGFDSPEVRELFKKARQQLEERALAEAEKLQQPIRELVDSQ